MVTFNSQVSVGVSLRLEPLLDVAGAVADVPPDPVADGSLASLAPSIDRGDRNAEKGCKFSNADQRFAGLMPVPGTVRKFV